MYDRNGNSERITTKLGARLSEYICERNTKFRLKILSRNGVVHHRLRSGARPVLTATGFVNGK